MLKIGPDIYRYYQYCTVNIEKYLERVVNQR